MVYADEAIIIVNKPAGIVVHPEARDIARTRYGLRVASTRFPDGLRRPALEGGEHCGAARASCTDSTRTPPGLLVVGRTPAAYEDLVRSTETPGDGSAATGASSASSVGADEGTIGAPIGPPEQQSHGDGGLGLEERPARTHYKVDHAATPCRSRRVLSWRCMLETGRTHQIRVHFAGDRSSGRWGTRATRGKRSEVITAPSVPPRNASCCVIR